MATPSSVNPAVHGHELNSQPVDHKSATLTTILLSHFGHLPSLTYLISKKIVEEIYCGLNS